MQRQSENPAANAYRKTHEYRGIPTEEGNLAERRGGNFRNSEEILRVERLEDGPEGEVALEGYPDIPVEAAGHDDRKAGMLV